MKNNNTSASEQLEKQAPSTRPLGPVNFKLMAAAGVMIVIGFLLMLGSGNDMGTFNEDIFSTRRIVIGPTIAFLGFIFMAIGIIWKGKKAND